MFFPMIDRRLRVFRRFDIGFVIRQTELAENFSHVGEAIFDTPLFANEIGDDARSPAIGRIAERFGTLQNHGFEFVALVRREFRRTSRTGFPREGMKPVALDGKRVALLPFWSPSHERGERNAENFDDFVVVETTQNQLARLKPNGCLP